MFRQTPYARKQRETSNLALPEFRGPLGNQDHGVEERQIDRHNPLAYFIKIQDNPFTLNNLYCSFRLFMHPFIDFKAGLKKLHTQVTLDLEYAASLASDLAFKIIDSTIQKKKRWPVDGSKLPTTRFIEHSVWPNASAMQSFGDHWHELPLTQCYDIPEQIPPATLYGDKSHSV